MTSYIFHSFGKLIVLNLICLPMVPGEIIRKLRNLKGVKQSTIAGGLGISQAAYSKIEKSACVKSEKLKRILLILKSSEEDLSSLQQMLNKNSQAVP